LAVSAGPSPPRRKSAATTRQEGRAIASSTHGPRLGARLRPPRLLAGALDTGPRADRRRRASPWVRLSRPAIPSDELYLKCSVWASAPYARLAAPGAARHSGTLSGDSFPRRSSTRVSAAFRNLRTRRPPAGRARTRGRGGRPARRARRSARTGRRAQCSPRSLRFRVPRPKRSAGRPPLHRKPARGRARLRFT
jgi:hypothetical protein